MDPDGLSTLILLVAGVLALWLASKTGAVFAEDAQKEQCSRLGFEDRLAGLLCALAFAAGFFVWGLVRALGSFVWEGALCFAVFCAACILCGAVGFVRGSRRATSLFDPIGKFFAAPAKLAFRLLHLSAAQDVTEEDLLSLVDDVEEQDLIDETQKEMIANIVELDDVTAGDIMTHRTELISVPDTATAADVVHLCMTEGVSRIPVYHKSIDDIVGIISVKDLFSIWNDPGKGTRGVQKFMRSAMFVPEACRAKELLVEFRNKHTQIAVVVDEYGGTSGVVTMEDVLEEIVGNIQDEFDNEEEELVRTADGVIASGSADLEDVFDALELPLPEETEENDFDSVGGLVIDRLGRIPADGEKVSLPYGGILFTVLKAGERRVEKVKCTPLAAQSAAEAESEEN